MVYSIHYSLWCKIVKKIFYKSCFLDLERIKIIYINSNGKNCFYHFSNSLLERIMFDNRGLIVAIRGTGYTYCERLLLFF